MQFHLRNYNNLLEYLDDESDIISENLAAVWIEQLLQNEISGDIPRPRDFLTEDKVDIWKRLKLKISDADTKKRIDDIWIRWTYDLNNQERNHYSSNSSTTGYSSMTVSSVTSPAESMFEARIPQRQIVSSPSPLPGDMITQYFTINIFADKESEVQCGTFKYAMKQSGKYVCLTEACRVPYSMVHTTPTPAVTLQTLRCHARKRHSVHFNAKRKIAFLTQPFVCGRCNKSFVREQTLRSHLEKMHPPPAILSPVLAGNSGSPLYSEDRLDQIFSQRNSDEVENMIVE